MGDRPTPMGAALTARPLLGNAWRRYCAERPVPYLASSTDALGLAAATPGAGTFLVVLVDGPLATRRVIGALRAAGSVVLLLAPATISATVRTALTAGVDGLATIGDPLTSLRDALDHLAGGRAYASPGAARLLLDEHRRRARDRPDRPEVGLSSREREVLQAMVAGLTTKAIAQRLGIAVKTVEAHRSRLFTRLHVRSQSEAVTRALTDERLLAAGPAHRPV